MFTLSCKDQGIDCPFVAEGESKEDVLKKSMAHQVEAHGMPAEELSKMDVWQKAMPFVKEG